MSAEQPDTGPVIGPDGYPRAGHTDRLAGRRVWQIDTDGEHSTMIEGHGPDAVEAARLWGDEGVGVDEGWARFATRCDCAAFDDDTDDTDDADGTVTACDGSCDCGGNLPPCGDDWAWQVTEVTGPDFGAAAVSWVVPS